MDESIRVHVVKYKDRKNLAMRYLCPLTGKHICRSTGTSKQREAEKIAAKWESELQDGRYDATGRMGWDEFREYHEANGQASLRASTLVGYSTCFNAFEKHCRPKRVADLTSARVSAYTKALRLSGLKEATVASHLRYLKSIARWANRHGLLAKVPAFDMPKTSKVAKMKGRPITTEEFERMLEVVPSVVGDKATESWRYLLMGLWWSGLRLGEAMQLRWDHEPGGVSVLLDGKHSILCFDSESHKAGRVEQVLLAGEAVQLIEPNRRSRGYVFEPFRMDSVTVPMARDSHKISKVISKIGKTAKVVVDKDPVKYASAHDLRRAFASRWSRRVTPADLKQMMRHRSIETTMSFYVFDDARAMAARLWDAAGNIQGNIATKSTEQEKSAHEKTPSGLRVS